MPFDDNWSMKPDFVLMAPDTFRDAVAWGLVEQGWSEEAALAEADRRMSELSEQPKPDLQGLAEKIKEAAGVAFRRS